MAVPTFQWLEQRFEAITDSRVGDLALGAGSVALAGAGIFVCIAMKQPAGGDMLVLGGLGALTSVAQDHRG